MTESKHTPPRWYCVDRDGVAMLCAHERDARAQVAENDYCWPGRAPHRAVLMGDVSDLAAEVERLRVENDGLRAKLGNSPEPCAYCALPAAKLLECQHGFPGCHRADDMVLCGHFGAAMDAAGLRADLDDERRKVEALETALRFYAQRKHFALSDADAWDTVSGEPQNYWCDDAGTATVEDGTIARAALAASQKGGE